VNYNRYEYERSAVNVRLDDKECDGGRSAGLEVTGPLPQVHEPSLLDVHGDVCVN
jgi:hypothetical protein